MKHLNLCLVQIAVWISVLGHGLLTPLLAAEPMHDGLTHEINVTLFAHSCSLTGPYSKETLTSIHSVSPAQIPEVDNQIKAKSALTKLRSVKNLPTELDLYIERADRRLQALSDYYEAMSVVKNNRNFAPIVEAAKKWVNPSKKTEVLELIRKSEKSKVAAELSGNREKFSELFLAGIEPDPEDDFHRTIGRIGVKYQCTLDEPGSDELEEAEDPVKQPPSDSKKPLPTPRK